MSKFFKGALLGALISAAFTLLTTKHSGAYNRKQLKDYQEGITSNSQSLFQNINQLKNTVQTIQTTILPTTQATVQEITRTIREFTEDNQPRIKRVIRKVNTLTTDIEKAQDSLKK